MLRLWFEVQTVVLWNSVEVIYWDLKVIVLNNGSWSWRTLGFCPIMHGAYSHGSCFSFVLSRCCFHRLPIRSRNYEAHSHWLKLLQFRTKLLKQFSISPVSCRLFRLLCWCTSMFKWKNKGGRDDERLRKSKSCVVVLCQKEFVLACNLVILPSGCSDNFGWSIDKDGTWWMAEKLHYEDSPFPR